MIDLSRLAIGGGGAVEEGYSYEAFDIARAFLKPYVNLDDEADRTYHRLLMGYRVEPEKILEEVDRCERAYDSP